MQKNTTPEEVNDENVLQGHVHSLSDYDHPDGYSIGRHRVVLDDAGARNNEEGSTVKPSHGVGLGETMVKIIIASILIISIAASIAIMPIVLFGYWVYTLFGWMYNKLRSLWIISTKE